jgi:hypothetical protein
MIFQNLITAFLLICLFSPLTIAQNLNLDVEYLFTVGGEIEFGEPGYLMNPQSAVTDSKGNIYISDHSGRKIHQYSPEGVYQKSFGGVGRGPGEFDRMAEIAIDEKDRLLVLDRFQFKVARFNTDNGDIEEHLFEDMPQINMMTLVSIDEKHFAGVYMEAGRHVNIDDEIRSVRVYEFGNGEKQRSLFEIFKYQFDPDIALQRSFGTGIGHKLARYSEHELVAGHIVYTGRHFIIDTNTGIVRIFKNEQLLPPHYHLMNSDNFPSDFDQRFAGTVMSSGSMGRFYYQAIHQSKLISVIGGNLYHIYRKNEKEGYEYKDYLEVYSTEGELIFDDKLPDTIKVRDGVRYRSYLHLNEDGRLFVRETFDWDDPRLSVYQVNLD